MRRDFFFFFKRIIFHTDFLFPSSAQCDLNQLMEWKWKNEGRKKKENGQNGYNKKKTAAQPVLRCGLM